jgi:dipeptidase
MKHALFSSTFPQHSLSPLVHGMPQVDAPVSVRKVMEIMGDTYAGTEFDQSKGLGAGPWGYPARFGGNTNLTGGWERPISMFRCA